MIDQLLEVELCEKDNFLKIVETLTRIGFATRDKKLVQTCHVLHKRGKYYICHFRELFKLDGFDREVTEEDVMRRNGIAGLLEQWGLCKIVDEDASHPRSLQRVKVISHAQKRDYTLKQNYTIGNRKKDATFV